MMCEFDYLFNYNAIILKCTLRKQATYSYIDYLDILELPYTLLN